MRFCSVPYAFPPALAAPGLFYKISIIISREKCNCKKSTGFRKEAGACRQCAKRSTGQQLKVIPLGDQQPFFLQLGKLHHTVRTRTRFFMKKGLGTFFVYRKFCGRTTRNGKRAKAGYHYDSGILPFALRNQVRFVRTWSSPYMARLGVVAAYVRTGSLYTSDKV